MKKAFHLLIFLACCSCSPETFNPLQEQTTVYYLLIKVEDETKIDATQAEVAKIARGYGEYRVNNLLLGAEEKTQVIIIRRFGGTRETKKLMKGLRRNENLARLEMKHISQANYREMLRQRTFYPDYSKDLSTDW
jgi:hypothetical protein